jgi:hypothetical protein
MKTQFSRLLIVSFVLMLGVWPALAQRNTPETTLFDGDADVVFRDDFEGISLADDWISTTNQIDLGQGELTIDPGSDETDAVIRPSLGENEGTLVLFQYTPGVMDFRLETGEEGTQEYRRWSFASNNVWQSTFTLGRSPYDLTQANLDENTWYYLLLRVGDNATFYIDVWERDNPVDYSFSY